MPGERPQEKILSRGPGAMTDTELLALLLHPGRGSTLELARESLSRAGGLEGLARMSPGELLRIQGIGRARVGELLAFFELARRWSAGCAREGVILTGPGDAARLVIPKLRDLVCESFLVLALDAKNAVKREVEISRGTLNASLVHPREVFKIAVDERAASVIVAHNHPSGNPEPSAEDLRITRQLVESGKILGIPLHDHLIVGGNRSVSLAERGLLG